MKVALYARFSSDLQRAASIEDQLRVCREYVAAKGWQVVAEFTDAGISGASLNRPGLLELMAAVRSKTIGAVVAEALDRFSRSQEGTAHLYNRLKFERVQMFTKSEGEIGPLHVGLTGTMNALFLQNLAEKTHRGLRGRIEAGRSGGGRCYGYRVVPSLDGHDRGELEIDSSEAAVIRRIFRSYVAGTSPKQIAKTLNADGIPAPRSRSHQRSPGWTPSTIHGHTRRGTGILNNELYVGRRVWNRQRYEKHPDTGRRLSRPNPQDAFVINEVPTLRIVDDDIWRAAKARQRDTRLRMAEGIVRARPKYLFSGLTRCGSCGGGFILSSHGLLTCFNARSRGTCSNRRSIKRAEVEARVLRAMSDKLLDPEAFRAFCEGFRSQMAQLRREHDSQAVEARRELADVQRRINGIVMALSEGFRAESVKTELARLEQRQTTLSDEVADLDLPDLQPELAGLFRQKTEALTRDLQHEDLSHGARESLRSFLEEIVIPPGQELMKVVGNVGQMLAAAQGRSATAQAVAIFGCGGGI